MLKLFQFYVIFNSFLGEVLCQELYVGCYKTFIGSGLPSNINPIQSVSQCLTKCRSQAPLFAAVKDGSSCYCGNVTNSRVPSSKCNLTCSDNNGTCGGINLYAVYTASGQELYIGCFAQFSVLSSINNPIQSASQCLAECRSQTSLFAALKDGSSCYCGKITNTRVPSSNCNLPCGDNNGACGGNNFYAVYTGVPTYLGCFIDKETRDMTMITGADDGTMTLDKCYGLCSSSNYIFMGVQYMYFCYCDQQYGKYGRAPESDCNMKCQGDGNQICGGPYRNSIYSVGHHVGLNKNYSEVFHCLNGATDMQGTCNSKTCQHGWKGTKCNQRDCSTNDGNCGQQKCAEIIVGNQIISECVCNKGFQFYSIFDNCTDIDECALNTCDNSTSTCNNTIGSFECNCKKGFVQNLSNKTSCQDKNECQSNLCNAPNETCINTIGSFMCICSPGYNYTNYTNQSDCRGECSKNLYKCNNATCVKMEGYKCEGAGITTQASVEDLNVEKIVGGVVGTIAVIIVAAATVILAYCLFKKRRRIIIDYGDEVQQKIPEKCSQTETKIYVSEVNNYFANYKKDINDQFNKCPKDFGHPQSAASSTENLMKNRFKKMYPYDRNRVKLNDEHDYINASFVQTYGNPPNLSFIAAQGPKLETTEDFWKMIWNNNVKVIVILTKCHENGKEKCHQYWPDEGNMAVGDFVIKNNEKESRLNYQKRTFKVVLNNEEIDVCHYLYIAWMDNTVPENIFSLLNLREKVISMVDKKSQNNIVFHCGDGVGRTGTFIALDYLVRQAEQEGCVDFYECLKFLRNQRINMIQAPSQYELCFRAMAMFHRIGKSTFISTSDLNVFKTNVEKVTVDLICKQHELMEEEVGSNEVKAINKVDIANAAGELEAVFLPSSEKPSSYMAGSVTTAFSLDHLLTVSDAKCTDVILLDKQEISFWSDEYQQMLHKNVLVNLDDKEVTDFCTKYSFKIEKKGEMTYENVELSGGNLYMNALPKSTLVQVTEDVTTCYDVIIQLYSFVKPILDLNEKRMIAIISRGSYDSAGFLVAAFNIMQMMQISMEIDVYETVFELRNIQPEVIKNFDLFKKLYSFAKHYMNHSRSIMKTGRKTLMESPYENMRI